MHLSSAAFSPCQHSSECFPDGGVCNFGQCHCLSGLKGNGQSVCLDIDECLTSPCHEDAHCNNTFRSFECDCNEGFEGDGFHCESELVELKI